MSDLLLPHAHRWLDLKAAMSRASNGPVASRSRANDLCNWARALRVSAGEPVVSRPGGRLELDEDLSGLTFDDLSTARLLSAFVLLRRRLAASTCRRHVATLNTFCRFSVRAGLLVANPVDDDGFVVPPLPGDDAAPLPFHAFELGDVDAMLAAASGPTRTTRAVWPARDVAALQMLAGCGLRASELCGLQLRDLVVDAEYPLVHVVRGTKGSKRRDVPVPRRVVDALEMFLQERAEVVGVASGRDPLLVRRSGAGLNQQFLDRLVRRVASQSAVRLPGDAAAHAFRHFFGVQLALRNVPLPVIQELLGHADVKTTAVYTRAVARHLAGPLDEAGWL